MPRKTQRKRRKSESSCGSWSLTTSDESCSESDGEVEEDRVLSQFEQEDSVNNDERLQSFLSDCEMLSGFHWFSIQEPSLRCHNESDHFYKNDVVTTELSNHLHSSLVESWDGFMSQNTIGVSSDELVDVLKINLKRTGLPTFRTITTQPLLPKSKSKYSRSTLSSLDKLILQKHLDNDIKMFTLQEGNDDHDGKLKKHEMISELVSQIKENEERREKKKWKKMAKLNSSEIVDATNEVTDEMKAKEKRREEKQKRREHRNQMELFRVLTTGIFDDETKLSSSKPCDMNKEVNESKDKKKKEITVQAHPAEIVEDETKSSSSKPCDMNEEVNESKDKKKKKRTVQAHLAEIVEDETKSSSSKPCDMNEKVNERKDKKKRKRTVQAHLAEIVEDETKSSSSKPCDMNEEVNEEEREENRRQKKALGLYNAGSSENATKPTSVTKPCEINDQVNGTKDRSEKCSKKIKATYADISEICNEEFKISSLPKPCEMNGQVNGKEGGKGKYKKGSILHSYSGNIPASLKRKYNSGKQHSNEGHNSVSSPHFEHEVSSKVDSSDLLKDVSKSSQASGKKPVNAFSLMMDSSKRKKKKN